jgi:hypothetical protein
MNNPDEKTAVEQFGKGDKYFGVATLMATLPGLPMFGHGQVEGFGEKYGMEYRRAYHDETPDGWLVDRHERELFPLLHRRWLFAEVRDFLLYDLVTPDGHVNEDVFAYSNRVGRERALVVYNNRYADAHGRVRTSVGFAQKRPDGSKAVIRRDLADGLGLRREDGWYTVMRDAVTGLEHIRSSRELADHGLEVRLGAYGRHVFLDMREVADGPAGQYGRLAARLGGAGVPSVEDALRELQLQPVHDAFRAMAAGDLLGRIVGAASARAESQAAPQAESRRDAASLRAEAADRLAGFLATVGAATGVDGDPAAVAARVADEIGAALRLREMAGLPESAPEAPAAAGADGGAARAQAMAAPDAAPAEAALGAADAAPAEARPGTAPAPAAVVERLAAGDRRAWSGLLGYLAVHRIGELAPGSDPSLTSRAWFDELRLGGALAGVFRDVGLDESDAWRAADLARLLVRLPTVGSLADDGPPRAAATAPAATGGSVPTSAGPSVDAGDGPAPAASLPSPARALLRAWLADDDLRRFIRVNRWEGVAWFEREAFEELLGWARVLDAIHAAAVTGEPDVRAGRAAFEAAGSVAAALTDAAGEAGYRLDGLREAAEV